MRTTGQIIDRGASEADVISVSRIIKDGSGAAVGAIEIVAPQYRAKPETFVAALEDAATKLSHALGSVRLGVASSSLSSALEKEVTTPASSTASMGGISTPAANRTDASSTVRRN